MNLRPGLLMNDSIQTCHAYPLPLRYRMNLRPGLLMNDSIYMSETFQKMAFQQNIWKIEKTAASNACNFSFHEHSCYIYIFNIEKITRCLTYIPNLILNSENDFLVTSHS